MEIRAEGMSPRSTDEVREGRWLPPPRTDNLPGTLTCNSDYSARTAGATICAERSRATCVE